MRASAVLGSRQHVNSPTSEPVIGAFGVFREPALAHAFALVEDFFDGPEA